MVQTLAYCIGRVAPYYNLILVVIVILLFIKLFKTAGKKVNIKPWKFLFVAVLVYLGEEIITVFSMANLIIVPKIVFPLLETIIITLFIYVLLSHKENIKK
jgi:glycerol-3-phosphate acyltransferase PlsY